MGLNSNASYAVVGTASHVLRSGPTWTATWRTLMDIYSTIPGVDAVSQTLANKRGKYVALSDSELCSEHCICMLIIAD